MHLLWKDGEEEFLKRGVKYPLEDLVNVVKKEEGGEEDMPIPNAEQPCVPSDAGGGGLGLVDSGVFALVMVKNMIQEQLRNAQLGGQLQNTVRTYAVWDRALCNCDCINTAFLF